MRIVIDMNLSPRWVKFLANAGIEAAHWSAIGPQNAPDAEIMAYAASHGLTVLTHDLDFSAILSATQGNKPSVVQIRAEDISPEKIGRQVVNALKQSAAELTEGALVTVDPNRSRLRVLPLMPRS